MDEHPLEGGHRLRHAALRQAAPLLGASGGHYYVCVRATDAVVRVHGCRGVDVSDEAHARWRSCDGVVLVMAEADPDHMAPVGQLGEHPDDFWQMPVARWAFSDIGYTALLSANVAVGSSHRGLVAFVRGGERRWDVPRARLREAHALVADAFRAAWDLEAALAPPAGTLAIDADGAVHGAPPVVAWAEAHDFASWAAWAFPKPPSPTPLGQTLLRACPSAFVTAVADPRGGATFVFDPVHAAELPPILLLSPTLKRVACLAGAGATNKEIADALGKSADTVKEQLTEVYRRLGIGSRAELAAMTQRAVT